MPKRPADAPLGVRRARRSRVAGGPVETDPSDLELDAHAATESPDGDEDYDFAGLDDALDE